MNRFLISGLLLAFCTPVFSQSVGGSGFDTGTAQDVDAAQMLRAQTNAQQGGSSGFAPLGAREPVANTSRNSASRIMRLDSPVPGVLQPFGANLFTGGFSADGEDGLNPSYTIQSGDRVSIRIWGATQFNQSLVVDHQGNIFIPGSVLSRCAVLRAISLMIALLKQYRMFILITSAFIQVLTVRSLSLYLLQALFQTLAASLVFHLTLFCTLLIVQAVLMRCVAAIEVSV